MPAQSKSSPVIWKALLLFVLATIAAPCTSVAQDNPKKTRALLPEAVARRSAIDKIMPVYSEQAVRLRISGTIQVKLEISAEGRVLIIKANPRANPLLTQAVADAVQQWQFKPWVDLDGLAEGVITRLIFRFSLSGDQPQVELVSPEPDTRINDCLECTNSAKEMREWREWKDVWRASASDRK